MRARAPASSANLGPGFDTLAVALGLYVQVEVEEADALSVTSTGEGSDLPVDATHLAARVAIAIRGHDHLAVRVHSDIPVGRGLGSSAAVAAAAAAAAGAPDALAVAAEFEGHPENAAASVLGGLVTATLLGDRAVAANLPLDPALAFVVLVPERGLATTEARSALPAQVPHAHARFNLGRMGLLVAGLGDRRLLVPQAAEDRLHQQARARLFPEATRLMAGLLEAGALAACWSGAGPSLLAVTGAEDARGLVASGERLLGEAGVAGRCLLLPPDLDGLSVQA